MHAGRSSQDIHTTIQRAMLRDLACDWAAALNEARCELLKLALANRDTIAPNYTNGVAGTGIIMSLVIALVTILTGSGVAAFTSLVPLAPAIAQSFGTSSVELAMMLQLASECARPLSPVAGMVIIVAGFAGVSPMAVVRRTWIPCVLCAVIGLTATVMMM